LDEDLGFEAWLVGWLVGIMGAAQFIVGESGDVLRESDGRLWYFQAVLSDCEAGDSRFD
jgi:hypothetical protein